MSPKRELSIYISGDALALLKKLDFPCSERVLASAAPTEEGVQLTGSRDDFESLAGWVAGEANHADRRAKRRLALLYDISEVLEAALTRSSSFW
jgi:hypothetical protein